MRPATLLEIARRNDYPLPAETEEGLAELYDFRDFAHFIEVWILTTNALQTAEDFRQVVVDYAAEAASHGAVYLEGIFSPSERVRRGVGWDEIFSGYCDGAQQARELHGVEVRLTPDIVRGFPLDEAEQVVRYSAAYRERGVLGVGLGGLEAEFPPEPYEPAFALARELGLASVPHAGEVAGPPSVRGALEELGADRLRHGIRAVGGPRPAAGDRRPPDRARRLPDLEPAHAGGRLAGGAPAAEAARGRSALLDLDRRPGDVRHRPEPRLRGGRRARARRARRLRGRARGRALRRGDEGPPARASAMPTSGRYPRAAPDESLSVDRSVQTDSRAEPASPDDGTASGALASAWPEEPHRPTARSAPSPIRSARRARRAWEEQLFFSRLRRHAKIVYVLLALVFVFSFVLLGVGSGSNGISDALQSFFGSNSGSSVGSQISDKQKAVARSPKDVNLYLDLAGLYQSDNQEAKALADAAEGAAGGAAEPRRDQPDREHLRRPGRPRRPTTTAPSSPSTARTWRTSPGLDTSSPLGQALTSDPYTQGLQTQLNDAYTKVTAAYQKVAGVYKQAAQVAKGTSDEPNALLQWASAAQSANDVTTAITAYQRFLKVAPDNANAPAVRQTLAQLQASLGQPQG